MTEEQKLRQIIADKATISREKDGNEAYARAQFRIGKSQNDLGDKEAAIAAWQNVDEEVDAKLYAKAQLNIGIAQYELGDIEAAIATWKNIHIENDTKLYASVQFSIGVAQAALGDTEAAIATWQNVDEKVDKKLYANAQFNIGLAQYNLGDNKAAMATWQNVDEKVDKKLYAKAQFNIGLAQYRLDDIEAAIATWKNIHVEDDTELYASIQFSIGVAQAALDNTEAAIATWQSISKKDSTEQYVNAQFRIGLVQYELGNKEATITAWQVICEEDITSIVTKNRILDGLLYWIKNDKQEASTEEDCTVKEVAQRLLQNIKKNNTPELAYYTEVLDALLQLEKKEIREKLANIFTCVIEIKKLLRIDFTLEAERKVAHYTSIGTFQRLLEEGSPFRLNTISNVNDPSEGAVLMQYITGLSVSTPEDFGVSHTFISCFTFNHDSLNQFRLYGKAEGIEATGISLVFKKTFFNRLRNNLFVDIALNTTIPTENRPASSTKEAEQEKIAIQPLYRCIYLDPETGYLRLAQREAVTFYKEGLKKPQKEYEDYVQQIQDKRNEDKRNEDVKSKVEQVEIELENIKNNYKELIKILDRMKQDEIKQKINNILSLSLLPLRYLVKHAAFQEEQECRMVYITSLNNPAINMQFDPKVLYVEYQTPVKNGLEKVYLGPAAKEHQHVVAKLLCDCGISPTKAALSSNPYRAK